MLYLMIPEEAGSPLLMMRLLSGDADRATVCTPSMNAAIGWN